jgi:hypothetical protein
MSGDVKQPTAEQVQRRTALVEIITILQKVDDASDPGVFPARLLNAAAAYFGMTPVATVSDGAGDGVQEDPTGW